jgi:TetR/AcrR family transcriptional repressor of nem operon
VVMGETLRNDARAPLERLAAWIDTNIEFLSPDDMRRGCLIGNFTAEASEHSDAIRHRLIEMFTGTKNAVAYCLEAAVKAGEVPAGTDCDTVAAFIVEAMQGANLVAKAERSPAPVERFKRILFSKVLH